MRELLGIQKAPPERRVVPPAASAASSMMTEAPWSTAAAAAAQAAPPVPTTTTSAARSHRPDPGGPCSAAACLGSKEPAVPASAVPRKERRVDRLIFALLLHFRI